MSQVLIPPPGSQLVCFQCQVYLFSNFYQLFMCSLQLVGETITLACCCKDGFGSCLIQSVITFMIKPIINWSPAMQLSDFVYRSWLQTELDSTCSYYHYSYYCCFVLEFSLKMCCTFTVINGSHIHWIFQPGTYASDLLFREEST